MFNFSRSIFTIYTRCRDWYRERTGITTFEQRYVVQMDEVMISVIHPYGEVQSVNWDAINSIAIHTNDGGPYNIDLWWVLSTAESHCMWPFGAAGETQAMEEVTKRFPDINERVLTMAYGSTEEADFVCWER